MITDISRRHFLKMGFTVVSSIVLSGGYEAIQLASNLLPPEMRFLSPKLVEASVIDRMKKYPFKPHWTMLMRPNLCVNCDECKDACNKVNELVPKDIVPTEKHKKEYHRTQIITQLAEDALGRKIKYIPILCNQCNKPRCVKACPTRASYKDKKTGIVLIDASKCIICGYCVEACPYDARYVNEFKHSMDKCVFCHDARAAGKVKTTACVEACRNGVRKFGDLSNPEDEIFKIIHNPFGGPMVWTIRPKVESETKPNVFYI